MSEPTFTVADVLARVRNLKSDSSYSATNSRLWTYDAVVELFTQSPKARQDETGGNVSDWPSPYSADTDVVKCRLRYLPLLVDYVLGRAFQEDAGSQDHLARSTQHFEMFYKRALWIEHGTAAFNDRTLGALKGR